MGLSITSDYLLIYSSETQTKDFGFRARDVCIHFSPYSATMQTKEDTQRREKEKVKNITMVPQNTFPDPGTPSVRDGVFVINSPDCFFLLVFFFSYLLNSYRYFAPQKTCNLPAPCEELIPSICSESAILLLLLSCSSCFGRSCEQPFLMHLSVHFF